MKSRRIGKIERTSAGFNRVNLIQRPTPLLKLKKLSDFLQGPEILIKRDDLTGFALGGNKSRKLEFIINDALDKKAQVIITWGSIQSNWCLHLSSAAKKFGLKPVLILFKPPDDTEEAIPDGNWLLDKLVGAEIQVLPAERGKLIDRNEAMSILNQAAEEYRQQGLKPYLVPVGGSLPLGDMDKPFGALSYLECFYEICDQAKKEGIDINYVVHASGSGGTQAGLTIGAKVLSEKIRVIGVSVQEKADKFRPEIMEISEKLQRMLGLDLKLQDEDIIIADEYIKEGYGVLNREVTEAIKLVLETECIVLDPVYTGKAMAALFDMAKKGIFKKEDKIVFIHTGGIPALFPYRKQLLKFI